MINVFVVEDSRVTLDYLVHLLESDPGIRVAGTAADGEEALAKVDGSRPDVILMDIHLPGIDGFETTRRIMSSSPVPIVIITASTNFNQVGTAMRALEAGALSVLKKPGGFGSPDAENDAATMIDTVKLMSEVRVVRRWHSTPVPKPQETFLNVKNRPHGDRAVVAIGASTGGPPVIMAILSRLPPDFAAPVLVVQHISAGFTAGFADWLSSVSNLPVHVAAGGETPQPGHVYIAPDYRHLTVGPRGELETSLAEPLNGLRPSVGVLFRSVAERYGRRAIGVLLTGMGRDGADELKMMMEKGALTIAQNEESCVVFGMPGEAVKLGAAMLVLPPEKIAECLATAVPGGADKGVLND